MDESVNLFLHNSLRQIWESLFAFIPCDVKISDSSSFTMRSFSFSNIFLEDLSICCLKESLIS